MSEDESLRTSSQLGFTWSPGFDGGTAVIDYTVQYDQGLDVFTTLVSGLAATSYTVTGLTIGITYNFRVKARNSFGESGWSETMSALCAGPPLAPAAPTTTTSHTEIQIQWTKPDNQGAVIIGYKIYIRASDQNYYLEDDNCYAFSAAVVAGRKCWIPLDVLTSPPFSLIKGNSVHAKILATNMYGDSPLSIEGNGAVMIIVPDAPINLGNDLAVTNKYKIGIVWDPGFSDGGTEVLDYRVSYD